jgi:hypothetical protein
MRERDGTPPGQVFAGRATAVAGTDGALEDPTEIRTRSWLTGPEQGLRSRPSPSARAGVMVTLAVLAMVVVALAMALATR